jgi:hypothetical protein
LLLLRFCDSLLLRALFVRFLFSCGIFTSVAFGLVLTSLPLSLSAYRCPHPTCGRLFNVNSNMRRHYRTHGPHPPRAASRRRVPGQASSSTGIDPGHVIRDVRSGHPQGTDIRNPRDRDGEEDCDVHMLPPAGSRSWSAGMVSVPNGPYELAVVPQHNSPRDLHRSLVTTSTFTSSSLARPTPSTREDRFAQPPYPAPGVHPSRLQSYSRSPSLSHPRTGVHLEGPSSSSSPPNVNSAVKTHPTLSRAWAHGRPPPGVETLLKPSKHPTRVETRSTPDLRGRAQGQTQGQMRADEDSTVLRGRMGQPPQGYAPGRMSEMGSVAPRGERKAVREREVTLASLVTAAMG